MDKGHFDAGCSSAATHRLTQVSTTLNRRYVRRPTNIAIEEAANAAMPSPDEETDYTPSRLVNLGVHKAELEAALAAAPQPPVADTAPDEPSRPSIEPIKIVPAVLEFGGMPEPTAAPTTAPTPQVETPAPQPSQMTSMPQMNPLAQMAPTAPMSQTVYQSSADNSPAPTPPQTTEIDTTSLAMSIAADYAAASLGASVAEYGNNYQGYAMNETKAATIAPSDPNSVEAIARATSEAIASIRTASQPDEIAEQIASLQAFASNIKSSDSAPEMRELSNTIDNFIKIAMKSTGVKEAMAKKSTAVTVSLSPKATRAATKVAKSSAKIMATNRRKASPTSRKAEPASRKVSPMRPAAMRSRAASPRPKLARKPSPEELKERAIQQALRSVATMDEGSRHHPATARAAIRPRKKGGTKRFIIALSCAAACVAAIIYFVSTNMPDISVRVAAMQTGMQAAYPSYIPRDYSPGDIFSENGKITMIFNGPNGASFTLMEEKSSWDSAALLRNYVEPTWGEEYTTTHEQGITIYVSGSDAAWVNGGILYRITSTTNSLTKKQLRNIVVSL